ncbi:MAG: fibronectin type III domain-containing protein [Candidatus Pacebacteria bacterium]|nr:fibronectin type III domain-containing protein [Candidatus Paceibacterota bacterium]MDR3582902.1 fibronectin type III domain-containing protein [Candidatus Paceibacterota bacterium]
MPGPSPTFFARKFFPKRAFSRLVFVLPIVLGSFLFLGTGRASAAATHFIRTDGNDTYCTGGTDAAWNSISSSGQPCAWATLDYTLTGKHISYGDTVTMDAGTYQPVGRVISSIGGTYSGQTTTIAAKSGDTVNINMPSGCVSPLILVTPGFLLQHLNFTNTNSASAGFLNLYTAGAYEVQDSTFDGHGAAAYVANANANNVTIKITRCKIKNIMPVGAAIELSSDTNVAGIVQSSEFNSASLVQVSSNETNTTLDIRNNTIMNVPSGSYPVKIDNSNSTQMGPLAMYNNIIQMQDSNRYGMYFSDNAGNYYITNPSSFSMKGNIFYNPVITDNTSFDNIIYANNNLIPIDPSNKFINPNFVSSTDLHLNNSGVTNYASQRGISGYLPGTDANGSPWSGTDDVGCYANPTAVPNALSLINEAAFLGDSIMKGTAATSGNAEYNKFSQMTGVPVVTSGAGVGGLKIQGSFWLADKVVFENAANTVFYAIGVNNYSRSPITPANMITQEASDMITSTMEKLAGYGVVPIWLGAESGSGTQTQIDSYNATIEDFNSKVEASCANNDWSCGSILDQMKFNSSWESQYESGGYYGCTNSANCSNIGNTLATDVHPNNSGHALIAGLAEYLYFNRHTIGADKIDTGAGARIYANGQFRDLGIASGNTANLSITPQSGSWTSGDYAPWLDVTINTWNNSGDREKNWTEDGTNLAHATQTLHTVGNLVSGQGYTIKIDDTKATNSNITGSDCSNGVCTADSNGQITFTYLGGYSTHTFDVSDTTPPSLSVTSPTAGTIVSGDDTITFTDSEITNPQCSLDNTNWTNCTSGTTSFSQLTGWSSIAEKDTFILYLKDTDLSGNTGTTEVDNLTKADTQAPVRSDGAPSGELSSGTSSTTLSLKTDESATCKYGTEISVPYDSMANAFTTTGGTSHSTNITGLAAGTDYVYYVRCKDGSENANDTDYLISFSIATKENSSSHTSNSHHDTTVDLNLSRVSYKTISPTEIDITWHTNNNADEEVRYGLDQNLKNKKSSKQKNHQHLIKIQNLAPNTKYYFRASSEDGNESARTKIYSITLPADVRTPVRTPVRTGVGTQGNASQPAPSPQPSPDYGRGGNTAKPSVCSYTVQSGDTLWSIAKKVYGDATQYQKIIDQNKNQYPNIESKLSIGEKLTFGCDNNSAVKGAETQTSSEIHGNASLQNTNATKSQSQSHAVWWNPFTWF